jgi:LuxR family maltose regulon positive regulatory protein
MVAREQLQMQLLAARRLRCIAIHGPAGYGKTTAMVAFRSALLPLGFNVAWLTLSPEDNDVSRWMDYLLASFNEVDAGIVREAKLLAESGTESEAVERIIFALVRSIAEYSRELFLVLDDLHCLTNGLIHEALQWLMDFAPENFHVVLVSRSVIPISLARLRSQGLALELDLRDLRFSSVESEEYLRTQLGNIDRRDAQLLHELTDGWIAGLQLFTVDWRKKEDAREAPHRGLARVHVQNAHAFGSYFEREVLCRLSPNELDLLVLASICSRFCASLCGALLGYPEATTEAASVLARLESDNIFLTQVESSEREPWYRLHPLLGEFLRARVSQRGDDDLRRAHKAAWLWFRDRGLLDEAVHHAVRAGDSAEAAALLEKCGQSLLMRGDLRKLIGLVRELPAEQVQSRIGLRLWMVRSHLYARDFERCAAMISELSADIPSTDHANRFTLTLLAATLSVQKDNTDEAMSILPGLLHPPEQADATAIGSRNNILSWLYMHRGEYERARQIQRDAPRLLVNGAPLIGTAAGTLLGQCLVGLSYSLEGDIARAERIYRDVLHEADRNGGGIYADPAAMATALLGEVLYELNNITEALQLLEDRVDVLERVSIPDSVLRVMIVLSSSHWLAGRELDAFSYIERLHEYSMKLGLDRLLAYSLGELVHRHLQRGEFDLAKENLTSLIAIDERHSRVEQTALGEIELIVLRSKIRWHLAVGDVESAAVLMDQLLELCERRGRGQFVAQLHLLKGVIDDRRGQPKSAKESVLLALRRGRRLGLIRSLLDADPTGLDLIRRISAGAILDPLSAFYAERLFAAQETAQRADLKRFSQPNIHIPDLTLDESLSEREMEVVRLLAHALPNKKIARTLNLSPETVKWHLKNIYGKLGVAGRDEAVARIRDIESGRPDHKGRVP